MRIEGIRKFDSELSIYDKLDRVLLNPIVLGIATLVRRLFDLDSMESRGRRCRLETTRWLAFKIRSSLVNLLELVRSRRMVYVSSHADGFSPYPRHLRKSVSSSLSQGVTQPQAARPINWVDGHRS